MLSQQLITRLDTLLKRVDTLNDNTEINDALEFCINSLVGSEFASIWIYDEQKNLLFRERDPQFITQLSMLDSRGVLYKSFMTKEAGIYNALPSEKEYVAEIDNVDSIRMKSKITVPLLDGKKVVGIMTGYSSIKRIKNFSRQDLALLEAIAPYVITAIAKIKENRNTPGTKTFVERRRGGRRSEDKIEMIQKLAQKPQVDEPSKQTLDFVANVVHDIRTPANGLVGFLGLLEEQIEDTRLKEYVSNAMLSAQFINELTTSILDRVENQLERSVSKVESVSTGKFFSNISEIFVSNMHNKKIGFNVFIDPMLPREIIVDTLKLKRVIINLIGNAYKFTPANGCIEFSVRYKKRSNQVHIFVKDNGIGIAKEKQEQIFEAFKQAEENTKENYGGTGLGLAISAGYVKEMGGELKVESALEQGSVFYFDMPLVFEKDDAIFEKVEHTNHQIAVLMDNTNGCSANNIARYLVAMGIPKERIQAVKSTKELKTNTTHMIVFQSKLYEEVLEYAQEYGIELLVVEEDLFSISKKDGHDKVVISQYRYFANELNTFLHTKKVIRVLIADSDTIGVTLLKNILRNEFCQIEVAKKGEDALKMMQKSHKEHSPYSIVFMDHMVQESNNSEIIVALRNFEQLNNYQGIYCVSVSGNLDVRIRYSKEYDEFIVKPFDKKHIRDAYYRATS